MILLILRLGESDNINNNIIKLILKERGQISELREYRELTPTNFKTTIPIEVVWMS